MHRRNDATSIGLTLKAAIEVICLLVSVLATGAILLIIPAQSSQIWKIFVTDYRLILLLGSSSWELTIPYFNKIVLTMATLLVGAATTWLMISRLRFTGGSFGKNKSTTKAISLLVFRWMIAVMIITLVF